VYVQRLIVAPLRNHCCHLNATIPSFIDVGVDVTASNINVFWIVVGMQQQVPFAFLLNRKIFNTAVNSTQ